MHLSVSLPLSKCHEHDPSFISTHATWLSTSTPQAARRREAEEAAQLEGCTFVPEMSLTAAAKRDREARMGSQGQRSHGPTLSSKFEVRH